jgi:hypothetical protein
MVIRYANENNCMASNKYVFLEPLSVYARKITVSSAGFTRRASVDLKWAALERWLKSYVFARELCLRILSGQVIISTVNGGMLIV